MDKIRILWADDEMELLKPQLFFLEKKGYQVETATNGHDVLNQLANNPNAYDLIFLDESMPGITGLETLAKLREAGYAQPVVMVTKNEAENIMDEAIGSEIADYLIKPVNPNQLILTIKKLIDNKRLISEKNTMDYQIAFRNLFLEINSGPDYIKWVEIYKKLIQWEIKMDQNVASEMQDILSDQKAEANSAFSKYIMSNYQNWFENKKQEQPVWSHELMSKKVFQYLNDDVPAIFILLDNLRFDQWKVIEPILTELFVVEEEDYFYSILPTTTQYSRNAIFAGMLPSEIEKDYPDWWLNDNEEGGKNLKEPDLLMKQIKRTFRRELKVEYMKITNAAQGKSLIDNVHNFIQNNFTVIVYNFIDMLSHVRTEMEVLKELASDESAYRSLTKSWFTHSPLWSALQKLSTQKLQLFIATDHGTIRVKDPVKVIGDRETTANLRYKVGKNLNYDKKEVFEIKDPHKVGLPRPNLSSTFIFARNNDYCLYPNNYNHFLNYYKNTFQHGGISLEEMICPVIRLRTKV